MLEIVIIRENSGYKVGDRVRITGGCLERNTVRVPLRKGTARGDVDMVIGEDAVFLNTGDSDVDSDSYRDMMISLFSSVDKAGGNSKSLVHKLYSTTLGEFMRVMAPNGIRFTHIKKVDCDGDNMPDLFRKNDSGNQVRTP